MRVGIRILALQEDLIQTREELRFQATHDALTGILSRGAVLDLLHRELERAVRSRTPIGVLMLDVDHFKKINDTYGHSAGDLVLKEVTHRMSHLVRSYDLVGRYGGEEFLIVLPDCDNNHIRQSAERIRLMVASTPILGIGPEISVTMSIGATVVTPGTTLSKEILATADAALYRAKNAGRNCTVVM
jgi:diguanylate cyclase (GGDEF)-like protein